MESGRDRPKLTRNPRLLFTIGFVCVVVWFGYSLVNLGGEEGTLADIEWLATTLVALVGLVSLALGVRAALLRRR